MIIFPAIDIQDGKAVRLRQGRKENVTVFSDNPVEAARHWQRLGAKWLHVVDLDGAFAGSRVSAPIIGDIVSSTGMPVQVGGGIRSVEDARIYLEAGVKRLIIGTLALEDEKNFQRMCRLFPGKVGVSLDAKNGLLMSRGWVKETGRKIEEIVPRLADAGSAFIIYTDINRDGMQSGLNLAALRRLLEATTLPVLAAGGIANMEDVKNLCLLNEFKNLDGFISGRALYENTLDFAEATQFLARHAGAGPCH